MAEIHYFPRYSQRENVITNNTLLLFLRVYDWNRRRFQRFIDTLLEGNASDSAISLGLNMHQQVGIGQTVLDGFLEQSALRLVIETKRDGSSFHDTQLLGHLQGFERGQAGFLLLLSPDTNVLNAPWWSDVEREANARNITLAAITFSNVIASLDECLMEHDEEMRSLLDDFEAYCSEEKLLNSDHTSVFVPPCGQSLKINIANGLYFCPSAWSRRNTKFIGFYSDKAIRALGIISKVLLCDASSGTLVAKDVRGNEIVVTPAEEDRIRRSIEAAHELNGWDISTGHKFYLCDEIAETCFRKSSRGGIQGHRYLSLLEYLPAVPETLAELATKMSAQAWE